ncbi:MAG TPA: tetratricopeptide repeat protein, partial [Bryobacterales bacterium]|nr:tetratricopeptide repeat protein [Bryobacterales bacterium]
GAMGVVYRALDTHLDRPVAIKVLRPESVANEERRRRFVQEAKAASALNHPNIITIYDISTAGAASAVEQPMDFIAMEYIDGATLSHLIGRKGMRWQEALKPAVQMADALAAAHKAGLVHRDLKPANIMVNSQGLVKVLDFGLAKLVESSDGVIQEADPRSPTETVKQREGPGTERGAIVGTVAYMSPEQAEGRPVDGRSDIFAFGSVLYEMLTGRWPFQGETRLAILAAILREEPRAASTVVDGLPSELERILARCLRKDPSRRFQHMADVKVALQELKEESDSGRLLMTTLSQAVTETVRGAPRRASPAPRRRAAMAAGVVVAVLLAAAGWLGRRQMPGWMPFGEASREKQLAVLPFQNVSGDEADRAFCDGLVETLTSKLTQLEQFQGELRVVPASEVRREKVKSAREAREVFGVPLVITGSVSRSGEEVLLTANLVDAKTLLQIRSRTIRTRVEDLSSLQDSAVKEIVDMLQLEIEPQAKRALSAGETTVPGAYDFYLRGRGYLQDYDRAGNVDNAIALFDRALEKDPNYALAYAGLGEAYWQKHRLTRDPQWIEQAQKSCDSAVRLNDQLAPVHVTLGVLYRGTGKYEKAVEELTTALKLDPGSPDAYRELAAAYEAMGNLEQAEATYRKAIQLRPSYWAGYSDLGAFDFRRGRYAEAETQYRAVIGLTPDNANAYSNLGGIYHLLGRLDEAEKALQRSIAIKPTASAYSNLGTIYYFQGRYAEAVPMMEKAIELGTTNYKIFGNLAEAYQQTPQWAAKAPDAFRRAVELAERQREVNPKDAQVWASLAVYHAKLGNQQKAGEEIEQALRLGPQDVSVVFKSALVYELTGRRDRALEALAAAIGKGYSMQEIRTAADLEQLRQDPRYRKLVDYRAFR